MKKMIFAACAAAMMCSCSGGDTATNNPFFETWSTPWGVPPFEQIKPEHYKPAFLKAMELQKAEVESIVNNTEEPTFENTIVALDQSGSLLTKVSMVFYGQTNANTNDELQAIQAEISPLLTKHGDDISLNAELFERVKAVYAQKE